MQLNDVYALKKSIKLPVSISVDRETVDAIENQGKSQFYGEELIWSEQSDPIETCHFLASFPECEKDTPTLEWAWFWVA